MVSAATPGETNGGAPEALARIRAAMREMAPELVALVRNAPDAGARAVGTWTVGDVAAHISHTFRADTDALAGRPVPEATVTKAGVAEATAGLLAEDPVRDPVVLADRIAALAGEFDDVAARSRTAAVGWLQGLRFPPSAVAGHLLNECLIHGHDIATTTGRPWRIQPRHALLALEEFVFPLIAALPPTALVDQEKAGSFRARVELRPRGGRRTVLVFDRGELTVEADGAGGAGAGGAVDARISADPTALILLLIGRQGIAKPLLAGKIAAWGRRPWKPARMLSVLSPP